MVVSGRSVTMKYLTTSISADAPAPQQTQMMPAHKRSETSGYRVWLEVGQQLPKLITYLQHHEADFRFPYTMDCSWPKVAIAWRISYVSYESVPDDQLLIADRVWSSKTGNHGIALRLLLFTRILIRPDPVRVLTLLADQPLPLSVQATTVFMLHAGYVNHTPDIVVPFDVADQLTVQ